MDNKEKLKEIVEHIKNENNPNDIIKLNNINFNKNYNYNDIAKKLIKILYKNHPNNIANLNSFDEEDVDIFINTYYETLKEQLSAKNIINTSNKIHNIRGCKIFFSGKQSSPNGKSVGLACGRHALNNLYGAEYFTACITQNSFNAATAYSNEELDKIKLNKNNKINLTKFAKSFLNQQELTVKENYDIKILRGILNRFGQYGIKKQNANSKNKLNYNNNNNINNKDVLGYLIATGGHYSVIKKCGNNWVFLDSLNDTPQIIDINFLKEKIKNVINKNNPNSQIGVYLIKKTTNSNSDNQTKQKNLQNTVNFITLEIPSIEEKNIKPISQELGAKTIFDIIAKIMDLTNYNKMNNNQKEKLLYQKIIQEKDKELANEIKVTKQNNIETLKELITNMIKPNYKNRRNEIIKKYKTMGQTQQLKPNAQVIGQQASIPPPPPRQQPGKKNNAPNALVKQPPPPPPRQQIGQKNNTGKASKPLPPQPRQQLGQNTQVIPQQQNPTEEPNKKPPRPFTVENLSKTQLRKTSTQPKPQSQAQQSLSQVLNRMGVARGQNNQRNSNESSNNEWEFK
jgi:hypothetical protein